MQSTQEVRTHAVPSALPWAVAAGAVALYLLTLNHWVSLNSLPLVAKVAGWDWVLPHQSPLFFALTYPVRWLPAGLQPMALNVFSAVCAALSLALLARSVMLLPHDRTHEQRQRERSEFSLLSVAGWWLPPALAVLVCGLELTFWEHATVASGEMLDLLVFAYAVRCLLEYRIDQRESWLGKLAFVYGLGMANNYAMIAFFPCFLVAMIWIMGLRFFRPGFMGRMVLCGLAGLALYLLLPVIWMMSNHPSVTFLDALRSNLALQKGFLLGIPALRSRVLVLSLTSILPVLIMGIRWPSSFGDTSAAGALVTNVMFRVSHVAFLGACLWVAFGQKFSPRALGYGLPFLTFYYLGALSVGYMAGYLLLVFGEHRSSRSWKRRSGLGQVLGKVVVVAVWLAFLAVPVALLYKNFPAVRQANAPTLRELASALVEELPAQGAYVLSDDPYSLLLLEGHLSGQGSPSKNVLLHTRSLGNSDYHYQLSQRFGSRWPGHLANKEQIFDDGTLLTLFTELSRSNAVYYLHPSFGFFFERFSAQPKGLGAELKLYPSDSIAAIPSNPDQLAANQAFWARHEATIERLKAINDSRDAAYARGFYSRSLNSWAVTLQRHDKLEDTSKLFQLATDLKTNNVPAFANLEYARSRKAGAPAKITWSEIQDRFGPSRGLTEVSSEDGPFDTPELCLLVAQAFASQDLVRQAIHETQRALRLDPTNITAEVALAGLALQRGQVEDAIKQARALRQRGGAALSENIFLQLVRLEANAEFARKQPEQAEKLLREAHAEQPKNLAILDTLVQLYAQMERHPDALATLDKLKQIAPENPQVDINRATVFFNTKAYDKALATLDELLQRLPNHPPALIYKAFIHIQTREHQKALPLLETVLGKDPNNVEALTYRGVIAIETKDYSAAIDPLSRILKKEPDGWNALRNRAIAYLQMGELNKAGKDYERLTQILPRFYVGYYGLGEVAYRQKKTAAAIRHYERYLSMAPADLPELAEERKLVTERLKELKAGAR